MADWFSANAPASDGSTLQRGLSDPDYLAGLAQQLKASGHSDENIAAIRDFIASRPVATAPASAPEAASSGDWFASNAPDAAPAVAPTTAPSTAAALGGDTPAKPQVASGSTFAEKIGHAAELLGATLPAAGGMVGGLVGGTPGAAIGGGAGQGYRDLIEYATELPGAVTDVAHNLLAYPAATMTGALKGSGAGALAAGEQAAGQAIGQKAGDALVAGGNIMSKWLMNRATTRVSAALMRDFPELSDTLINNALTVSKGGEGQARSLLTAAKMKVTAALKNADASGATIPIQLTDDLADSLKTALLEKAVKSGQITAPANQPLTVASARLDRATQGMFTKIDAAVSGNAPLDLAPSQADILKTQLQKESRALYANRVAPNGQKAIGMSATELADFATQLNTAIDTVATGYKAGNAEVKPFIGAVRGIHQAIRPNGNLYQAMVRPAVGAALGGAAGEHEGGTWGSVAGAAAGAALTSPAGMSREAILLAHPAVQGALRQLPKPLAEWLVNALGSSTPQPSAREPQP